MGLDSSHWTSGSEVWVKLLCIDGVVGEHFSIPYLFEYSTFVNIWVLKV